METIIKMINEPDTPGAWIGIIGVLAGVLVTSGIEGWKSWLAGGRDRRRELHRAGDELVAASNSLIVMRNTMAVGQERGESILGWMQQVTTQSERVQKASEAVIRLGDHDLGRAAQRVTDGAFTATVNIQGGEFPAEVENALTAFKEKWRQIEPSRKVKPTRKARRARKAERPET